MSNVQTPAQTFTICINEEQRAILVAALKHMPRTSEGEEELLALLVELPDMEADCPRAIHGLCL